MTGGAGFIGSNFVRSILNSDPDVTIVNLDKLTYAGNLENLADVLDNPRHQFIKGDICDEEQITDILGSCRIDSIVHFAAESHVDRSIMGSSVFVQTNIVGTHVLLEQAKAAGIERFVHVSTDEVYGSLGPTGKFTESTPLHPNSPYAASKASSDLLALAYFHTHGLPVVVSRCSNNFGPFQFPEKLIPLMIINALNDRLLPVYGDGMNVRDWIYVDDHSKAIEILLRKGTPGEVYNVGGSNELTNIEIVKLILRELGKQESLISFVKDRPGHDRRYAMDSSKMKERFGWTTSHTLEESLKSTIRWYLQHDDWWLKILSGEYQEYYRKLYHDR